MISSNAHRPRLRSLIKASTVAAFCAAFLTACCEGESTDERGWPNELVLGLVPALEAEALVDNLDPLTEHLEAELGIPVRSFVPQDYTGLVEALGSGRADIGMLPPFAAMLGQRRYDIEPILMSVRKGETSYRSQWLTSDAAVCDAEPRVVERICDTRDPNRVAQMRKFLECNGELTQMRGESVAFVDPSSTSGYLIPGVQLQDLGLDVKADLESLYVGAHDAAVLAVYAGDTRFGVSYQDARNMICDQYPDIGEKVIVFNYSIDMPNDGVQLRPGLPDDLKQAIADAFISLAESQAHLPDEQKVLWVLYEIDGFAQFQPGTYDRIVDAYELMRQ